MRDRMAALREVFLSFHEGVLIEWAEDGTPYDASNPAVVVWMDEEWNYFLAGYRLGVEDAAESLRPEASDMIPRIRSLLPTGGE